MTPMLIVLAMIVLGVAIVLWAIRPRPNTPPPAAASSDTAWNDPITPADAETTPDPFADAPLPTAQPPHADRQP